VQEALFKGTFDARKYFSEQRSQTVMTLATSGKLPAVAAAQTPIPALMSSFPDTDPLHPPLVRAAEGHKAGDNLTRQVLRPLSPVASLPATTAGAPRRLLSYEKQRGW
jgi:hypothetical protein